MEYIDIDNYGEKECEKFIQATKHLIERNKELEEEKEKAYKEGYIKGIQPQILENWNKSNANIVKIESQFIPKSKVREKIEELEKDMVLPETRAVLQELLEED